ncbi:MAG: AAA family ATPase [Chloroflexota bacterium]|nr:AAA family ATPase [Chloroflexota bacterium]
MYIQKVEIENICSIKELKWETPLDAQTGWHVVIGDNGSGKSTLLRSIALALVGQSGAMALRQDWNDWLTRGESRGQIKLVFTDGSNVKRCFSRSSKGVELETPRTADQQIGGEERKLFSASYGPFRRFSGGDKEYRRIFKSNPRLAAHLSVFGEDVALTEYLSWFQDLQFKRYEKDPRGDLLNYVKRFVNQEGFLPHQARFHNVGSEGVEFIDGDGHQLLVKDLSDGYRSILSMTFELVRQLAAFYDSDNIFDKDDPGKIAVSGVVLIDEIDAHLHPTWQRQVGLWFREHFPQMQFIVTTHSPLICQAASVGTVWRLPKPGSGERASMVSGISLDRLLYGNILDAYGTEVFGQDITRSKEARMRLGHLAELNRKELEGKLTKSERKEQESLRAAMPTSAHTLSAQTQDEQDDTIA